MTTDLGNGAGDRCEGRLGLLSGLSNRLPKISSVLGGVNRKFKGLLFGRISQQKGAQKGPKRHTNGTIWGNFVRDFPHFF
jgi:hypothetical protein